MALLKVARIGHPVLRQGAQPVPADQIPCAEIQRLVADMAETLAEHDGAGLAAPQVHVPRRIVVVALDEGRPRVWINPRIEPLGEEAIVSFEGCLSVPEVRAAVPRASRVEVRALDEEGSPIRLELDGFAAVVAQHECDHLDGILFVDRCNPRTLAFLPEYRRYREWLCREAGWEAEPDADPHDAGGEAGRDGKAGPDEGARGG